MKKITKYIIVDLIRNKFIITYSLFLFVTSILLFLLEDNPAKAALGLMNLVLFILPLVCLIFTTIYLYNSVEFIELLLSQPVKRSTLLIRISVGIILSFIIGSLFGIGLPVIYFYNTSQGITLIGMGIVLSVVFAALAVFASVFTRDKARGIGFALLLWLFFAFIFDGIVLFVLYQFADYPMEKPMIVFAMLNPIDLSRIMLLLKTDLSAMLGFTGAIFQKFFGSTWGIFVTLFVLLLWVFVPFWAAITRFKNKDL